MTTSHICSGVSRNKDCGSPLSKAKIRDTRVDPDPRRRYCPCVIVTGSASDGNAHAPIQDAHYGREHKHSRTPVRSSRQPPFTGGAPANPFYHRCRIASNQDAADACRTIPTKHKSRSGSDEIKLCPQLPAGVAAVMGANHLLTAISDTKVGVHKYKSAYSQNLLPMKKASAVSILS